MKLKNLVIIYLVLIFNFSFLYSNTVNIYDKVFETIKFDVVSKKIFYDLTLDKEIQVFLQKFFDNNVKVNGFEGNLELYINNYNEKTYNIDKGKKIEISLEFILNINKSLLSEKKIFKGVVNSYGNMTGNFSLNDFDNLKRDVKLELVSIFSKKLKSKF